MSSGAFRAELDEGKLSAEVQARVVDALRECGEDLKAKSEAICPKVRGYNGGLVSTASLEIDEETLTMRLRYTAPHAHLVHERTGWRHKPGEQAKFIEQPLDQSRNDYLKRIAAAIDGRLR